MKSKKINYKRLYELEVLDNMLWAELSFYGKIKWWNFMTIEGLKALNFGFKDDKRKATRG